jgi:hypothetical protein
MKDREGIYAQWAPSGALWSPWVKPVMFASMPLRMLASADKEAKELTPLRSIAMLTSRTALVLDLPGAKAIDVAIALARSGYRPIPLYNGVPGSGTEFVPSEEIAHSLASFADDVARMRLPEDAPPAFLLDSGRMAEGRAPRSGVFDNRWMVFPQDFPSGSFLRAHGIETVLVVQERGIALAEDLAHVARGFRRAGLTVLVQDFGGDAPPQEAVLSPGWWFRSVLFRALVMLRLRRSSAGGFGSTVPEPGRVGFVG